MLRRIRYKEQITWKNPIKKADPKPFLGEIIFPADPDSPAAKESKQVLDRFYCDEREGRYTDFDALGRFVRNPDQQLLVIWGDVGIGKSWFVRHEFVCGELGKEYHAGVIDILGGGIISTQETVYRQLCPILESYFDRFCGSVEKAFLEYIRFLVTRQRGRDSDQDVISTNVSALVNKWLPGDYSREYAERLLLALEYVNEPLLFLVIDNIDRAGGNEQQIFLDITKRILKNHRIRVIVPLRRSSALLSDRFKGLKEQAYDEMELTPLKLDKMLARRFLFSKDGVDLSNSPPIRDGELQVRFPQLFREIFTSESGKLLLKIAGKSAREALLLTDRLIHSDHLRGLANIGNAQYAMVSLMLLDYAQLDPNYPYLINLFDNNEPHSPGNALIRFRVLEYLYREKVVSSSSTHFLQYMERLGFDDKRLKQVLSLMVGTSMIYSQEGIVAERFDDLRINELGTFEITDIGKTYWETLIRMQWYFVSIKQGVTIPERYIHFDKASNTEYITHADLCHFLKEEEEEERFRVRMWENKRGRMEGVHLEPPSEIAKRALRRGTYDSHLDGSKDNAEEGLSE